MYPWGKPGNDFTEYEGITARYTLTEFSLN